MKKTLIFGAMTFLLMGGLAFGEKATIIDFSSLDPDIVADENGNLTVHGRTVMDFSQVSSIPFDETQQALMQASLALTDWEVQLNDSAHTPQNALNSLIKSAPNVSGPYEGQNVMGVRVVFPTAPVNASARIKPPFEIPAFEPMAQTDDTGAIVPGSEVPGEYRFRQQDGEEIAYGITDNVGAIKSISVTTYGYNYPHSLYVLLSDSNNVERRYYMGTLNFDGWRNLIWNNPNYIEDIRRREISISPLYPEALPYAKFMGFLITRDATQVGGNFVAYFKQVDIIYDKAVAQSERDIVDEDLWGIITEQEQARQAREMESYGTDQVYRFIEEENRAKDEAFTSAVSGSNGQTANDASDGQVTNDPVVQ